MNFSAKTFAMHKLCLKKPTQAFMCLKIWPKPLRAYDGLKFLKNPKTILKINQMVSLKQGKYTNHTKKPV